MWQNPEPETMSEGAVAIHEWFKSLREAGFTQHQCWHLILEQVDCEHKGCYRPGAP